MGRPGPGGLGGGGTHGLAAELGAAATGGINGCRLGIPQGP
jgi:hypothetical protein